MSNSSRKRGRRNANGAASDPFAADDDASEAQVMPPPYGAQVTIPTVPASLGRGVSYGQVLGGTATVVTPPPHSGGYGLGTFANPLEMQQMEIPLTGDTLEVFGLEDLEHQQAVWRVLQQAFRDGSAMMRYSIKVFCEGLEFSVAKVAMDMGESVARAENELRTEHAAKVADLEAQLAARNEEIDVLKNERNAEATKASRLSEQVDMYSVNEAALRNDLDEEKRSLQAKEVEARNLRAEVDALKTTNAELQTANEKASLELDLHKAHIGRLKADIESAMTAQEEASRLIAKHREENARLKAITDRTSEFVDSIRVMCQNGGPFFNYVTGSSVECPVLCNSGAVIPFKALLETWTATDGYLDGSAGRSFSCANTGFISTSIAQRTHVELVYYISRTIGVCKKQLPCVVEYLAASEWVTMPLYDTLEVMARVCRIYRRGSVSAEDTLMLNGQLIFSFVMQTDENDSRKLMISIQSYGGGDNYEGRIRMTDEQWNPFPGMMFRD